MKEDMLLECITDYMPELLDLELIANNSTGTNSLLPKLDDNEKELKKRVAKIASDILQATKFFLSSKEDKSEEDKELLKKIEDALEGTFLTKETSENDLQRNITSALFGIGKLINLGCFLYEKYKLIGDMKTKEALDEVEKRGKSLMPKYISTIINDTVEMIYLYAVPDEEVIKQLIKDTSEAKTIGENYRKNLNLFSDDEKKVYLEVADYAYTEIKEENEYGIRPLRLEELPLKLQVNTDFYNSTTGILDIPDGMRVLFGKCGTRKIIGFAGTSLRKIGTLGADIQQLISPSLMYLRAVGIVNIMINTYPNEEFVIAGHSLGGGLTQAAILANVQEIKKKNIKLRGIAFNSAGLSKNTLDILAENIDEGSNYIAHYRAENDPISQVGALAGSVEVIKGVPLGYHTIVALKTQIH